MSHQEDYPLLEESEKIDELQLEEDWDYILIFKNPYDMPKYEYYPKDLYYTIPLEKAHWIYDRVFRIDDWEDSQASPTHKTVQKTKNQLDKHAIDGNVKVQVLVQLVFQNTVKVLQKYLKMKIKLFYSRDRDEIFCKIQASQENLQSHADLIDYSLQFKAQPDETCDFQAVPPYAPFEKTCTARVQNLHESSLSYYKRYDRFDKETQKGSFFRSKDRIQLIYNMLNSCFDIGMMESYKITTALFPSHMYNARKELIDNWGSFKKFFKLQNIEQIRVYFGERLGMYFAWLEFMLIWMAATGIVGTVLFIVGEVAGDTNDTDSTVVTSEISLLVMALFLPVSATILEQLWIRRQNELAWKWGQLEGKSIISNQRPEYEGKYMKDPVSGKLKKVEQTTRFTRFRRIFSFSVILLFILLAIVALIALFSYRSTLSQSGWGPRIVGIINALQIKIFNTVNFTQLYKYVATFLSNWENHETFSDYENAMILKLFLFQFVNSYSSLFYIAFAKGSIEGCYEQDCLRELMIQLSMIFFTMMALNLFELGIPILINKYKIYSEEKNIERAFIRNNTARIKMSYPEKEAKLEHYDTPLADVMEVVITFGYVVLFSAAYPLTPMLAVIVIAFELRVDAWKLCNLTKRPYPAESSGIGLWYDILQVMSLLGVMTNTAIIIFTTNVFDGFDTGEKWLMFIVIEHALIIAKILIAVYTPDKPTVVKQGEIWSMRIANERLYGKLTDVDQERKARNLEYQVPENFRVFKSDPDEILYYDNDMKK